MDFFKNFDWSAKSIFKVVGVSFLGIILLSLAVGFLSFAVRTVFNTGGTEISSPLYGTGEMNNTMVAKSAPGGLDMARGVAVPAPIPNTGGVDFKAEDFEARSFNAQYRTAQKESLCGSIAELKTDKEIIFLTAYDTNTSCNYSFRVLRAREGEILKKLQDLNPENISESTETIQRQVTQVESQIEILQKKLASITATLEDAQKRYDELVILATKKEAVDSLAKLIDTKINTIDRLSQEKQSISEQIANTERQQKEMAERLKYSEFTVSIAEDLMVDWKNIQENWRSQVKNLVSTFDEVVQSVSIDLVTFILRVFQALFYFALSLVLLRFVWGMSKKIWLWGKSDAKS
ncbi:MAG: hypothetical protein WCJ84_02880 [Candidatus Peregrinibacteria bacterium]